MHLRALTGPAGADLAVSVTTTSDCALPETLKKIQLKTFAADGSHARTWNLKDVDAPGGVAKDIDLGDVPRNRRIEADVLVQAGTPDRKSTRLNSSHSLLSRMPSSA